MKTLSTSRAGAQQRLIRTILAPVDFSECSLAGLTYAIRFAREVGGRIIVLHVADLGPVMMTTGYGEYHLPDYTEAARRRCGDKMRDFLKRVNFHGVSVKLLSVAGYCPAAIHDAAVKEGADLIIISTHGRTGLGRALIGSVAEGTVRNAACPVLVVPSSARLHESAAKENAPERPLRPPAKESSRSAALMEKNKLVPNRTNRQRSEHTTAKNSRN